MIKPIVFSTIAFVILLAIFTYIYTALLGKSPDMYTELGMIIVLGITYGIDFTLKETE